MKAGLSLWKILINEAMKSDTDFYKFIKIIFSCVLRYNIIMQKVDNIKNR